MGLNPIPLVSFWEEENSDIHVDRGKICEDTQGGNHLQAKERVSEEINPIGTLILDFRHVKMNFCYLSHTICGTYYSNPNRFLHAF